MRKIKNILVKIFINNVSPLGQINTLSVKMIFFSCLQDKFYRGFVRAFPSAYTVSFFSEKKDISRRGKKRMQIIVVVSKSNKVKQT